jgi:hypothetical protein
LTATGGFLTLAPEERNMTKATQAELAEKALKAKQSADAGATAHPENEPTASEGAITNPRPDQPPMGALNAEGQRPVLERSRKVR